MRPLTLLLFALTLAVPATASAHVYLTSPAEGETVGAGDPVTITWNIAVNHGPPDTYDLMYSADGGQMYTMVAAGLPGSPASYDWTAPATGSSNAVLSILQHGSGGYEFMHSVHFLVDGPGGADMGSTPDADLFEPPDVQMPIEADELVPTNGAEVGDLLERRCAITGCHAVEQPQAGLDLSPSAFPDSLIEVPSATQDGATLVRQCDPTQSELLARLRGERALQMPPQPEPALTEAQIGAIEDWIAGGAGKGDFAPDACGGDPGNQADTGNEGDTGDEGGCSTSSGAAVPGGWLVLVGVMLLAPGRWRRRD